MGRTRITPATCRHIKENPGVEAELIAKKLNLNPATIELIRRLDCDFSKYRAHLNRVAKRRAELRRLRSVSYTASPELPEREKPPVEKEPTRVEKKNGALHIHQTHNITIPVGQLAHELGKTVWALAWRFTLALFAVSLAVELISKYLLK